MTLDIIVTHYKEPASVGFQLFNSIAIQRLVPFDDIGVILVNDGEENALPAGTFDGYPFSVCDMSIPKGGVSKARNAGLDASTADWVMFCDFDDCFSNIFALHLIFCAMHEEKYDAIWSCFTEEAKDTEGKLTLVHHDRDWVFIHGKVYRKQYLVENKIRFHEKLTIHEDAYFTMLAMTICGEERIGAIKTPIYAWLWNGNSVVRKDNAEDFILLTYDHLMRQRIALVEAFLERGMPEHAMTAIIKTVVDTYYDCQQSTWRVPKNKELLHKAENWFAAFLKRYANYYKDADFRMVTAIAKASRDNSLKKGTFFMEAETLAQWLDHIMETAKPIPKWEQNV